MTMTTPASVSSLTTASLLTRRPLRMPPTPSGRGRPQQTLHRLKSSLHCTNPFFSPWQVIVTKARRTEEEKKTPPQNVQVFKCFLAWPLMTSLSPGWMFAAFSSVTHFSTGPARTRLRGRREIMESVLLKKKKKKKPNSATDTRNLAVL